ncbi:efflux RND transporter permease subunit [Parvibaculum sp.]|uniref:efflux RND transporter permease subunit n=1 Tax=Parvibaculum sp. TaxID=2024848 RepID=UPI0027322683|nr:efflux RND transporter permease subunit [Parvibaculum sp.]MDP1627557.1 efflux RND transporter permease subunit [Parvibaculum sp.]MDP2148736.1 efflux RND transporter permease subunit [Parvibaculum sp.]MDP3329956.1 efflux RND transporter permease subunit [Parvibaculum sp.]
MWISDISIRRPVFAVMIIAALVVLGWISLGRVGVDLFPKVEFPVVSVTTVLEGASPEAVESDVTDSIEEQVNTISGIETLSSTSAEGLSQVVIQYDLNENVDVKAQDVRDKVSLAQRNIPQDAEQSIVQKVDPDAQAIMSIMIAGDLPIRDLTQFADKVVKERLQRISGVGSIELVGGRDREVRIWLDAVKMRAYGVTADDVTGALRREHAEIPGGRLETPGGHAEFSMKTKGEVTSVPEFRNILVAFRQDGAPTTIGDIARVEDGMEDERSYAELNGKRGVSLDLRKQSGRNTVEVARAVREELTQIEKLAPPGVEMKTARDTAVFIEGSADDVFFDIQLGIVLVVLVTLAFLLSVRATLIVAVAMPTSLIATFFAFYVADFTINMMTLMALSLAVGLLVDDAIVVLESIYRKLEEGLPPMQAASEGTKEVGLAVLAATFSICAVFVPIAFMDGVVGRFFFQYGLAITFSVLVSLLVSLTLTPMLSSRMLKHGETDPANYGRVARFFDDAYNRLDRFYGRVLEWALGARWIVMAGALLTIVFAVVVARTLPMAFDSRADRAEFLGTVELPFGAGLEETRTVSSRVAQAISGVRHVHTVFFTIASDPQKSVNKAFFYVGLTAKAERDESFIPIMDAARVAMLRAAPEAKHISLSDVPWISGGGFSEYAMMYVVQGPDLAVLEAKANEVVARMRTSPLFADAKTSYDSGKPEVQVHVDRRRAADLGVPVRVLAETMRAMVGGVKAGTFEEFGQRYDVRVRLEDGQRDDISKLTMIQVRSANGNLIDIANVARFDVAAGPAQIERQNRARRIAILANNPQGAALGPASAEIETYLNELKLPAGYSWSAEGRSKRMKETGAAIGFAFLLALIALYMILASQFNSFAQPAIIMLSAPLSFAGAFVALKISGQEMTMFSQIALLALMGLVMKNGILLVDYTNHLREAGAGPREAALKAGPVRLRPVLMTQIATVFGLIPVAISNSQGAEFRNAMGILVIGGLISSTVLTLVVVPVAYTLMEDARGKVAGIGGTFRRLGRRFGIGKAPGAPAE